MSKEYTLEEVKKHNKEGDLWIVWRGKVLDLTKFINEHPGGVDVLMETAGADATQGFEDIGHSSDAIRLAEEHAIGVLKGALSSASAPKNAASTQTSSTSQVKKIEAKTDNTGYILPVLLLVLAVLAYYLYA